jgi:hypothetical protein
MILVLLLGFSVGSFVKRLTSNEPAYHYKQKSLSISAMQPTDDPILMAKLVGIASLYGGIIAEQPDRDYTNAHSSYSGKWITLGPAFRDKYRLSEAQIVMVLLHEIGHWQTECAIQPSSFLGEQCADRFATREIKRFYRIQTVEHAKHTYQMYFRMCRTNYDYTRWSESHGSNQLREKMCLNTLTRGLTI